VWSRLTVHQGPSPPSRVAAAEGTGSRQRHQVDVHGPPNASSARPSPSSPTRPALAAHTRGRHLPAPPSARTASTERDYGRQSMDVTGASSRLSDCSQPRPAASDAGAHPKRLQHARCAITACWKPR
jgi:hypothetical protein